MISLKSFHLFFIFMSIILTVWFAIYEFQLDENNVSAVLAIISLGLSAGLLFYGIKI